jgi:TRAP-type uncharacterized transport system fused permease subunit
MMQAWKYTLPAFVVPVMFCLSPDGMGLLLSGSFEQTLLITVTSSIALAGFSIAAAGWIAGRAHALERMAAVAGAVALMVADYRWQIAGTAVIAAVVLVHLLRNRRMNAAAEGS